MQHLYSNNSNQGFNYIKHTHMINMIKKIGETCFCLHGGRLRRQLDRAGYEAPPQRSDLRYTTYNQATNIFQYKIKYELYFNK
jgi:hypothetical protein